MWTERFGNLRLSCYFRYTKTLIWDIADLESPTLMNTYFSSQRSIDHNQYVLGNLTYQSNYYVSNADKNTVVKIVIESSIGLRVGSNSDIMFIVLGWIANSSH